MDRITNIKIPDTTIGLGTVRSVGQEAQKFGALKILVITDKGIVQAGIVDSVKVLLEDAKLQFDIYDSCKPEPSVSAIEVIAKIMQDNYYNLVIGIGGGSNMDTTKVASAFAHSSIGLKDYIENHRGEKLEGKSIPKILLPTTAGTGAEWSMTAVVYDNNGLGYPFTVPQLLADKVIIDPELTISLPPKITAETGFDALTHSIEAYTSFTANIFSDMLASTSIKLIGENVRQAYAKGTKCIEARYNMSLAAAMAMNAATTGGMGLCHIIANVVQAKANITHGASLAIMLPAVMEYNLIGNTPKFAKITELLRESVSDLSLMEASAKSVNAVRKLISDLELPKNLREVGIKEADIELMAKQCYEVGRLGISNWNPRDAIEANIISIYRTSL